MTFKVILEKLYNLLYPKNDPNEFSRYFVEKSEKIIRNRAQIRENKLNFLIKIEQNSWGRSKNYNVFWEKWQKLDKKIGKNLTKIKCKFEKILKIVKKVILKIMVLLAVDYFIEFWFIKNSRKFWPTHPFLGPFFDLNRFFLGNYFLYIVYII